MPSQLKTAIKSFAASMGVTVYTLLLAVYQTLLHRYSNQTDILVASPAASRYDRSFENTMGYFVNLVAMRSDFADNPDFESFLRRTRMTVLDAIKHQHYPFSELVSKLPIKRDVSFSPLTQTVFVLQKAHKSGEMVDLIAGKQIRWAGLNMKIPDVSRVGQHATYNDLELNAVETSESFSFRFQYNTALFKPETIERMARHFQVLLEEVIADPKRKISELPLLTEAEKHQILVEWNDTRTDYPKDKCIHQLFEEQAEKTPDNIAVAFEDQNLTYAELDSRANQLARYLMSLGVGPEIPVGICMERSPKMIIGLMGILKAGGAYVPLDPDYPKERLSRMLDDSAAPVLLTSSDLLNALPKYQAETVCLDTDWKAIGEEDDSSVASEVNPDNLIYVIYTSGSTGTPKGAGVYHKNFVNLVHWYISKFNLNHTDSTLIISSMSFDLTQKNIFAPLSVGGVLRLTQPGYDPQSITEVVNKHNISWLNCAPSMFYPLVMDAEETSFKKFSSLRYVFLGGEPISMPSIQSWLESVHCDAELVNSYPKFTNTPTQKVNNLVK